MNKKLFLIFLFLFYILVINCYSITIIENFQLPSNKKYLKNFNINFEFTNLNNSKKNFNSKNYLKLENNITNNFNLTGIFKLKNKFYAIINGNSYTVGNEIDKYIIDNITIYKVILVDKKNLKKRINLEIEK